jgi:hypothetical protein
MVQVDAGIDHTDFDTGSRHRGAPDRGPSGGCVDEVERASQIGTEARDRNHTRHAGNVSEFRRGFSCDCDVNCIEQHLARSFNRDIPTLQFGKYVRLRTTNGDALSIGRCGIQLRARSRTLGNRRVIQD